MAGVAKAISIREPWLWCITALKEPHGKRVENRGWKTGYRGEVWLHASKKIDEGAPMGRILVGDEFTDLQIWLEGEGLPLGCIVARTKILDCLDLSTKAALRYYKRTRTLQARWLAGPYALTLDVVEVLPEPVPCAGALYFWTIKPEVLEKCEAQL